MPQGPAGGPRPFAKTHLKYTVHVEIPEEIVESTPKAKHILETRVNSPQMDLIEKVKEDIGEVIEAANGLAHPSRHKVIHEETEEWERGNNVPEGYVLKKWTYVMKGSGVGKFADTSTTSKRVWKLHEVLIKGNDEPIKRASARWEFDSGPLEITRVRISTD